MLHPDVYFASSLSVGHTVPQETLDELILQSEEEIAKERALRLLSARSYTAHGLFEKLTPYVSEDAAWSVVQRMENIGLVDDYDYAVRYSSDCLRLRGFSYFHTVYVLGGRGISREIAEKALYEEFGEEDSQWIISNYILKKYRRRIGDEDGERRTINAMLRRGHRYDDVRRVLDNLRQDITYYDNYPDPYER